MKGLIVYNGFRTTSSTKYKITRLSEEFADKGITIDALSSLDFHFSVSDSSLAAPSLDNYSFCIYLDKDENIAKVIESRIPLFNSSEALISCNDKAKTYLALLNSGIPTPKTILSRLCYREIDRSEEKISNFCRYVSSELSFPMICKECYGSLGLQVYLIKNMQELLTKENELILTPHLYQEFIQASCGTDYRVFTIGGRAVAYMRRFNPSDFRSNVALGGKGYPCTLSKDYIAIAEKASAILGLDYAGVDILRGDNDTPLLSEVNSNAFFTEIEHISKINITKLLVEHILLKIAHK